uniref:Peroxidase n=4 Tax=Aegilops tauschii subsp. strangulata TaxID=200361 RepID=A0A453DJW5_AEGTS
MTPTAWREEATSPVKLASAQARASLRPQKMASSSAILAVLVTAAALLSPAMSLPVFTGDASPDFHAASCPQLDGIVWSSVEAALRQEVAVAAGMLRLYFHDCFPQGCDASILLNNTAARETALGPNLTIQPRAMQLIESIRARAHAVCGPVVSCADITLLATRDIIVISGGPWFNVPQGNLDSLAPAAQAKVFDLPAPNTASVATLVESFGTRGLGDVADLVALSGAHTIGRSQCGSFEDRSQRADDTFSRKLAANCSKHPERLQNLDVITPDLFDNAYYKALGFNQGVFTSDMALVKNKTTAPIVKRFAESKEAFFGQFARSMEKLARVPKPAGNVGEIRRFSCFRTNAQGTDAAVDAAVEEEGFAASA